MAYTDEQKREFIRSVQQELQTFSTIYKTIPTVIPNGIFDANTTAAVKEFQKIFNLPVTGKVDFNTWNAIFSRSCTIDSSLCSPLAIEPYPSALYLIRPNDSGGIVYILQSMINALTSYFTNLSPVPYTGVFDSATQEQITRFQSIANLPPTGVVNKDTWNALSRLYNSVVKRPPLFLAIDSDIIRN